MTETATSLPLSAGTWTVDRDRTTVGFSVKHFGLATSRGSFTDFQGTLVIGDSPGSASAEGSVEAASVRTGDESRDEFLRSEFFDVGDHPRIEFASRRIEPAGRDAFRIIGDLTIRDVTREVTLDAVVRQVARESDGERARLDVTGRISRRDYGVRLGRALGTGDMAVGDKVDIVLDVSAVRRRT